MPHKFVILRDIDQAMEHVGFDGIPEEQTRIETLAIAAEMVILSHCNRIADLNALGQLPEDQRAVLQVAVLSLVAYYDRDRGDAPDQQGRFFLPAQVRIMIEPFMKFTV